MSTKNLISYRSVLLVTLLCFFGGLNNAYGQISAQRLEELKQKYDWGSIYLSYGIIPDIIQILDNAARLEKIRVAYHSAPPPSLIAFLSKYRTPSARRSIALFQINFSAQTPAAGFMVATDLNGNIQRLPMTPSEVLQAADWIDLFLTHAAEIARVFTVLYNTQSTLAESWGNIAKLNADAFVSETNISGALMVFRQMQDAKSGEFDRLINTDPRLYKTLKLFASQFDKTTSSFWDDFKKDQQANRKEKEKSQSANKKDLGPEIGSAKNQPYSMRVEDEAVVEMVKRGTNAWIMRDPDRTSFNKDLEEHEDNFVMRIYESYQQLLQQEKSATPQAPRRP